MSRYLILFILNLPIVIAGFSSALVSFKVGKIPRHKFYFQSLLWIIVLSGLAFAEPLYVFLFNNRLTATEPLSLFDVIEITGIVFLLYISNRSRAKIDSLERKLQELHQELSIRLDEKKRT